MERAGSASSRNLCLTVQSAQHYTPCPNLFFPVVSSPKHKHTDDGKETQSFIKKVSPTGNGSCLGSI